MLTWITDTGVRRGLGARSPPAAGCSRTRRGTRPRRRAIPTSTRLAAQAAQVAADAGIDRLLLIHLPPFGRDVGPLLADAQALVPGATLAEDGADMSGLLLG